MKLAFILLLTCFASAAFAQKETDTVYKRCPVFITDTVSTNNFFLEFQPATISVSRAKGNLTVRITQRDQFFTIRFRTSKLKKSKYKITVDANNRNEADAKYSFRSGGSASFVDVANGTIETSFDKEKDAWHLKLNGMIANLVERSVTYYRVRADFYIK